ncbi:hypothetical protein [Sphingomonas sp. Ag1]|uniref:hypothetical protein n=1 Tax=Sphingomonas sp. Ag1 TaxID=1642949 RepID=UPI0018CEF519|nr:hypothetical protein [Sphingomonas sp. Ag1]
MGKQAMLTTLIIGGLSKEDYAPMLARAIEIAASNGGEIIRTALLKPWDVAFRTLEVTIDHPAAKEARVREAFVRAFPTGLSSASKGSSPDAEEGSNSH